MSARPRRSAAQKAGQAITDWADSERASTTPSAPPTMSTRTRRSDGRPSGTSVTRGPPSSPGHEHLNVTIKTSSSKLREATSGRGRGSGGTIAVGGSSVAAGKRSRGTKRSYAESDSLDEEDDDDDEMDLGDDDEDDADGDEEEDDEDMDVDADGDDDEEDADGDVDMDGGPAAAGAASAAPTTIKIHNPKANRSAPTRRAAAARVIDDDEDDDEEELSEIEVSDPENAGDMSINVGGQQDQDDDEDDEEGEEDDEEEDAEGEDDDMEAGQDDEEDAEGELDVTAVGGLDSDEDGSRAATPDVTKMTRRQRARFEDEPQSYMKLSDEVQAKKVFTAEELSMRRQEMARRRRNLSEKRNEEVKMETINKLLKKQAPKTTRRANAAANDAEGEGQGPDVTFVRWVSTKQGSRLAVPEDMLASPVGQVFGGRPGALGSGKMVEEVK